ncbi:glycosyltransferase family 2 protein [Candidatus Magnetomonas plexicatena]|uniref:glycosyltransferase family 2 protein n=1 Tax=Candidatus Magnetomonas plexicatena TaxID=2552947 RepID=UPI004032F6F2
MNPLVSIIIPTYNRGELLRETLESVLAQTYQNFEVIIVDDYSEDATEAIVKRFKDSRIKFLQSRIRHIIAASRNQGIKEASGEFIAFVDSDDLWLPEKLQKQLDTFAAHKDILAVSTNAMFFPGFKKPALDYTEHRIVLFKDMLYDCVVVNSSSVIRKEVVDAIGYQDENMKATEDFDYWLRLLRYRDRSILVMKDVLVKYRFHTGNISPSSGNMTHMNEFGFVEYALRKHLDFDPEHVERAIKNRKVRAYKLDTCNSYRGGNMGLIEFVKHDGLSLVEKLRTVAGKNFQLIRNLKNNLINRFGGRQ